MDLLSFSQMLCSRLCHDLITPIGALRNGFELLDNCDEKERANLMDLTRRSAETALRRLTFYRAAFGYSMMSRNSSFSFVKTSLGDFLKPLKIRLEWLLGEDPETNQHPGALGQLLMNIALMGAEGMPYGGTLHIKESKSQAGSFNLQFQGTLVALRPDVVDILKEKNISQERVYSPLVIQTVFLTLLARNLNVDLVLTMKGNQGFSLDIAPVQA